MNPPTIGRIVHYVLSDSDLDHNHQAKAGEIRPAITVRVWSYSSLNLQVFADGDGTADNDGLPNCYWRSSVMFDETKTPGTWHWPDRA